MRGEPILPEWPRIINEEHAMPGTDERRGAGPPESHQRRDGTALVSDWIDLESLVREIAVRGDLAALIACACEAGIEYYPPTHADPGQPPHPGVHAAIGAFKQCMRF